MDFQSKSATRNPSTPTLLPSSSSLWSRMCRNFLPILLSTVLSCTLLLAATPTAAPELENRLAFTSVTDFSAFEYPIALSGLYANIGPDGAKSGGAVSGVVVASPTCESLDLDGVFRVLMTGFSSQSRLSVCILRQGFVGCTNKNVAIPGSEIALSFTNISLIATCQGVTPLS